MSRVLFQSTKGFILQNQQQRIQWANLDRAQPTASASSNNIAVTASTAFSSCLQLRIEKILKGNIINSFNGPQFRRKFYSLSVHSTQFTTETFHRYRAVMDVPAGLFRGHLDRFNGITVKSNDEYNPDIDFGEKLRNSLDFWTKNKYRGIWFYIFTAHAEWIPQLAQHKFEFHHAREGVAVMYRWLPTDEQANMPVYAHTMVGVGGLVFNDKDEVLVVTERYTLIPKSWKLPGGYVEPGENMVDAAIREVWEETGIKCTFKTVVAIRHSHGGGFGCSDIYVVIALIPHNEELKRCDREIAKTQWMKIDDYLKHPHVHKTNRQFARILQDYNKRGLRFTCEVDRHEILKKEYCLYYMKNMEESNEDDKLESEAELSSKI